jgi:hypothetical protein
MRTIANRLGCFLAITFTTLAARASTVSVAERAGTFSGGSACNGQTAIAPPSMAKTAGMTVYICEVITATAGAARTRA